MPVLICWSIVVLAGCEPPTPESRTGPGPISDHEPDANSNPSGGFVGIRARADAAFAVVTEQGLDRRESRIGPQPWPEDLPRGWPRPRTARVLADSRKAGDGRLLLIDVPDTPEVALETYRRALLDAGFEAKHGHARPTPRTLEVRRGDERAVLTFIERAIDRAPSTRLEILFLDLDKRG